METRKIELEGKISKNHAKRLMEEDKEMVRKAFEIERFIRRDLMRGLNEITELVGFGLLSEDEGVEVSLAIKKALGVFEKRDVETTANRVAEYAAKRVAEKIGGEVVEGGEENAEG